MLEVRLGGIELSGTNHNPQAKRETLGEYIEARKSIKSTKILT